MIFMNFEMGGDDEDDLHLYSQLAEVDCGDIQYWLFHGTVEFRVNDLNLSTDPIPVPVVDFAAGMLLVVAQLERGRSAKFEYTEGQEELSFDLVDKKNVDVSSDVRSGKTTVDVKTLADAVDGFSFKVLGYLKRQHTDIFENPEFLNWYPGARTYLRPI